MFQYLKKIVKTLFTRETAIFLLFLLLAFFFWLLHSVGAHKELVVNVPVAYQNIPNNIKISNNLPKKIEVTIKEENLSIFAYLFINKPDTLKIDLADINIHQQNGSKIFALDSISSLLSLNLERNVKIVNCEPSIILVDYITLKQKTLPVVLSDTIVPASQYILSDKITIEPQTVEVFGQESAIKDLTKIFIEPLNIDTLNKSQKILRKLVVPKGVATKTPQAQITIPIERATEKVMQIPIKCINFPTGFNMRSFPAEVTVKFVVAMSRFNKITENDFMVEADFLQKTSDFTVKLNVSAQPFGIENLRIEPEQVEFSLEKK
ncbi:MAG: hypothetical protein LBN95_01825 [Prevotellaceae bacterium]|jgi:methionine-rich copper-binding protein CopC|nr:hypothetical protein [Prevotellaceae bacterium]